MARIEEQRIRLNKYIAKFGFYSRRQADKLIETGRVTVNGDKPFEIYMKINPALDLVCIDNKRINNNSLIYIKFYKPSKVLTSYISQGNKKNLTFFKPFNRIHLPYSGRLDYNSEGLIIFCNDGDLIRKLQLPLHHIQKEYIVKVNKPLNKKQLKILEKGIIFNDFKYNPCEIIQQDFNEYKIILYEGKKRQIRNMLKCFDIDVFKLIRIRIGPIFLEDLKPGDYKYLTKNELEKLKNV